MCCISQTLKSTFLRHRGTRQVLLFFMDIDRDMVLFPQCIRCQHMVEMAMGQQNGLRVAVDLVDLAFNLQRRIARVHDQHLLAVRIFHNVAVCREHSKCPVIYLYHTLFSFLSSRSLNNDHTLHLAYLLDDAVQLFVVVHVERHIDGSRSLLARSHVHRRKVDLPLGKDLGDIHQKTGTVFA